MLDQILSVEAKVDRGWADPNALADAVDNWYANRVGGKARAAAIGFVSNSKKRHLFGREKEIKENVRFVKSRNASSSFLTQDQNDRSIRTVTCWQCRGNHYRANCPRNRTTGKTPKPPEGGRAGRFVRGNCTAVVEMQLKVKPNIKRVNVRSRMMLTYLILVCCLMRMSVFNIKI